MRGEDRGSARFKLYKKILCKSSTGRRSRGESITSRGVFAPRLRLFVEPDTEDDAKTAAVDNRFGGRPRGVDDSVAGESSVDFFR